MSHQNGLVERFFTATPDFTANFGSDFSGATIEVAGYNACDTSRQRSSKQIDVVSLPETAQSPAGPDIACTDTEISISVPEIANATQYIWELPAELAPVSGTNTDYMQKIKLLFYLSLFVTIFHSFELAAQELPILNQRLTNSFLYNPSLTMKLTMTFLSD